MSLHEANILLDKSWDLCQIFRLKCDRILWYLHRSESVNGRIKHFAGVRKVNSAILFCIHSKVWSISWRFCSFAYYSELFKTANNNFMNLVKLWYLIFGSQHFKLSSAIDVFCFFNIFRLELNLWINSILIAYCRHLISGCKGCEGGDRRVDDVFQVKALPATRCGGSSLLTRMLT